MNKLIFRKFSLDIVNFFLISSFSITFIVWIIQAVNLLDLVSDDGHSLNVYFYYVSLNLPKIFSKTIIFVFFISIFYVINKYNNSNELIVFWNNGIQKIKFINFILRFSIFFLILQLVFNLFIVPKSQNLGREYIKDSNIDFLPKLISEKKFINAVKNLTIFVEEYKNDNVLHKIYINEKIDNNQSKIIVADSGKIIKKDNQFFLRLYDGGITNINKKNSFALNFSETDYNLSNEPGSLLDVTALGQEGFAIHSLPMVDRSADSANPNPTAEQQIGDFYYYKSDASMIGSSDSSVYQGISVHRLDHHNNANNIYWSKIL